MIEKVTLDQELGSAYVSYALATVNRAIPSACDGLKVSQRRILQTAFSLGLKHDKSFRKLSYLDGNTTATLHCHGSAANVAYTLADMATQMHPLIDIHGSLGGISPTCRQLICDSAPAAPRYTEARLTKFAEAVFDIDQKFLPVKPNYDGTIDEIVSFIPALPMALVMRQEGIGTGYAVNSPSFRLKAIAKAVSVAAQAPTQLSAIASAIGMPDFPCRSQINPSDGLVQLHEQGRGSFSLTGLTENAETVLEGRKRNKHRKVIVVTSLPEGSAERFCHKVKAAVEEQKLQGVDAIYDLSNGEGIRIEVVLQADADVNAVLAGLHSHTNLRASFSANMTFVDGILPKQFTPAELLLLWLEAREACLAKVYQAQLDAELAKAARLCTLLKAIDKIDQVIGVIRTSESKQQAASKLAELLVVTQEQAEQVLAINLGQLVRTSASELAKQLQEAKAEHARLLPFCGASEQARQKRLQAIAKRAEELAGEFGLERMCTISKLTNAPQVQKQGELAKPKPPFADAPSAVRDAWAEAESLPYEFPLSLFKSWQKKQSVANAKEFAKAWHARKAEHLLWCHVHSQDETPQVSDADVRKFLPGVTAKDIKALREAKGTRSFRKVLARLVAK